MGWTVSYDQLGHGETVDSRMRKEMSWSQHDAETGNTHEIIASSTVGSTWYAAVRVQRAGVAPYVFALICLTRKGSRKYGDGFGYKDMDETVGPNEVDCPKHILDLLTPTDSKYANEWRDACHRRREEKRAAARKSAEFRPGMTIRTAKPLSYRGKMLDTFTIVPCKARGDHRNGGRWQRVVS